MNQRLITIGRVEEVMLPEIIDESVSARIDTGARTSAIWVTSSRLVDGKLHVVFFGDSHGSFTGVEHIFDKYDTTIVASSNGHIEERFKIKLLVVLAEKKIRATFTLADRSSQVYPVLVGRNVLRGKFIVDVKRGKPLTSHERSRSQALKSRLKET